MGGEVDLSLAPARLIARARSLPGTSGTAGDIALQIPSHCLVSFDPIGLLGDQAESRNQFLGSIFLSDHVLVELQRHLAGDAVVVVEQDGRGGIDLEQPRCPLACGRRDAIAVRRVRGEHLGGPPALDLRAAAGTRSAPAEARRRSPESILAGRRPGGSLHASTRSERRLAGQRKHQKSVGGLCERFAAGNVRFVPVGIVLHLAKHETAHEVTGPISAHTRRAARREKTEAHITTTSSPPAWSDESVSLLVACIPFVDPEPGVHRATHVVTACRCLAQVANSLRQHSAEAGAVSSRVRAATNAVSTVSCPACSRNRAGSSRRR